MNSELIILGIAGIGLLGGIGVIFGTGLGYAAKKFAVKGEPLVEEVLESLPMAQCGGCGYPGCEGYATAVVKDESVSPNLCFPGKKEVAEIIANLTGKELDFQEGMVATPRCSCIEGNVSMKANYSGFTSCTAAELAFGGPSACQYGCTGLGECRDSCPFDAIVMVNDFPEINPELCVGCALCVPACPKDIIVMTQIDARVYIPCSMKEPGRKQVKKVCDVGCVYCDACIKDCPADAISLEGTLIEIDHEKCIAYGPDCNHVCIESCPREIIFPYLHNQNAPLIEKKEEAEAVTGSLVAQRPGSVENKFLSLTD